MLTDFIGRDTRLTSMSYTSLGIKGLSVFLKHTFVMQNYRLWTFGLPGCKKIPLASVYPHKCW